MVLAEPASYGRASISAPKRLLQLFEMGVGLFLARKLIPLAA